MYCAVGDTESGERCRIRIGVVGEGADGFLIGAVDHVGCACCVVRDANGVDVGLCCDLRSG